MNREALSLGILALTACSPTPRGEWPPSETGFQCQNGHVERNAEILAAERARLDIIGNQLSIDPLAIDEEYGRRAVAAGCSQYDLLEAQEEVMRRENPDLENTI
jgi:hypothetical protein